MSLEGKQNKTTPPKTNKQTKQNQPTNQPTNKPQQTSTVVGSCFRVEAADHMIDLL